MTAESLHLDFDFIREAEPGPQWTTRFEEYWPAYRRWYFKRTADLDPAPDCATCLRMIRAHLPMMEPICEALTECAGGADDVARFLTLYMPPPSIRGCTQLVWDHNDELALIRNYDFAPQLCDGVILDSAWSGRRTIALTDCMIGALDGINELGLCAALAFGGDKDVGQGFGTTILLRAVLEDCESVNDAERLVRDVPVHMAYTMTLLDASGDFATIHLRPGRPAERLPDRVATNFQTTIRWPEYAAFSNTLQRQEQAELLLDDPGRTTRDGILHSFLQAPLYRGIFTKNSGTLYTAVYQPRSRDLTLHWPGQSRHISFDSPLPPSAHVDYTAAIIEGHAN